MNEKTFEKGLNIFGALLGVGMLIFVVMTLSSCGTLIVSEQQKELNYKIDKLYLEYNYKRDSLIIEHNKHAR